MHETLLAQHGINSPSGGPQATENARQQFPRDTLLARTPVEEESGAGGDHIGDVAPSVVKPRGTNVDKLRVLARRMLPPDVFSKVGREGANRALGERSTRIHIPLRYLLRVYTIAQ